MSGEDRVSFLQGLVSNDVTKAAEAQAVWAALLTPQGKYLHDFFIVADGESLLLDCEAARLDDLLTRLKRYRLRARVDFAVEPLMVAATEGEGFPDPRLAAMGNRIFLPEGTDCPGAFEDYETKRLTLGLPDGSRDIAVEKDLLLEVGFEELHGVDFKKGCYIGQEVTARSKYRGLVKKRLMPVTGFLPESTTPLMLEGREVGEMRSKSKERGLAMVRLEAFAEGRALDNGILPSKPQWMVC